MVTQDQAESMQGVGSGTHVNTPPSISLPKGGWAIRGIGEKFAADPVTERDR